MVRKKDMGRGTTVMVFLLVAIAFSACVPFGFARAHATTTSLDRAWFGSYQRDGADRA